MGGLNRAAPKNLVLKISKMSFLLYSNLIISIESIVKYKYVDSLYSCDEGVFYERVFYYWGSIEAI